jgi:hypothetical protein
MAVIVGGAVGAVFEVEQTVYEREPAGAREALPPRESPGAAVTPEFAATLVSLRPVLHIGDELRIRRFRDSRITGRYEGIEAGTVLLDTGRSTVRIAESQIVTIERAMPVRKRTGAVVAGVLAGLVSVGLAIDRTHNDPTFTGADAALAVAVSGASGAAAGALMARLFRHRELILVRSTPTTSRETQTHWESLSAARNDANRPWFPANESRTVVAGD